MSLIRSRSDERLAEQGMLTLTDEKLERAFREIEEASERRAQEEAKDDDGHPAPLPGAPTADDRNAPTPTAGAVAKKRHRGSISISRVGTYPDLSNAVDGSASPVPWLASVVLPAPPVPVGSNTMYKVQTAAASVSTLATTSTVSSFSRSHGGTSHYHDEELNHTTQKQTIIGRRNTLTRVGAHFAGAVQAVSNLAEAVSEKVGAIGSKTAGGGAVGAVEARRGRPRAMTRTRSKQALRAAVEHDALVSSEDPVVIGVQVQAKTTEEKRAGAESAGDEEDVGPGAGSSTPVIATVIHASKSESEIRPSTDTSSAGAKKGRPRTATGSGDALPPPPQTFATVSAGSAAKILASTSASPAAATSGCVEGAGAAGEKQERRKSQTLGPASGGGAKFRNTASKRLSILRTGLASPSGSAPLSPPSVAPLPSPRRSPLPSPSRSPSFPSLSPSPSSAVPAMHEQTTTIEVGSFTFGSAGAGADQRASRPALTRSLTHYARVLASKLKRRTVSAGSDGAEGGNGRRAVSSTAPGAAGVAGILGVTTSTTVVEEVKPAGGAQRGDGDGGEPSRYPADDEGQEIAIRVEGADADADGLLAKGFPKAIATPLPPSPSPAGAQSFGDGDDGTRGEDEEAVAERAHREWAAPPAAEEQERGRGNVDPVHAEAEAGAGDSARAQPTPATPSGGHVEVSLDAPGLGPGRSSDDGRAVGDWKTSSAGSGDSDSDADADAGILRAGAGAAVEKSADLSAVSVSLVAPAS